MCLWTVCPWQEKIEALKPVVEDTVEMQQRRRAILTCLKTAYKKNM